MSSTFYNKNASNLADLYLSKSTDEVRQRFEIINKTGQHICVWTDKSLQKEYVIDHCLPFAHWLNNNLWNLLPSGAWLNDFDHQSGTN